MGENHPSGQHQGGVSPGEPTFHNLPFGERRGTAVREVEATRVCAANGLSNAVRVSMRPLFNLSSGPWGLSMYFLIPLYFLR